MACKRGVLWQKSHRVFHDGEEEKSSDVAKTVDILVDGGEGLAEVFGPLQLQIAPLLRVHYDDGKSWFDRHSGKQL